MSAEDMTVDEALTIATHANRPPAHVKHAALRVLAQAYTVEHARLADLESERAEVVAYVEGLHADLASLRARVAELAAEREAAGTEWGVRWPDGDVLRAADLAHAHRVIQANPATTPMVRDVFAPGPWRVSS
jgi:hypothetical protein